MSQEAQVRNRRDGENRWTQEGTVCKANLGIIVLGKDMGLSFCQGRKKATNSLIQRFSR